QEGLLRRRDDRRSRRPRRGRWAGTSPGRNAGRIPGTAGGGSDVAYGQRTWGRSSRTGDGFQLVRLALRAGGPARRPAAIRPPAPERTVALPANPSTVSLRQRLGEAGPHLRWLRGRALLVDGLAQHLHGRRRRPKQLLHGRHFLDRRQVTA